MFCNSWTTGLEIDDELRTSLVRFIGVNGYGSETLCGDLARFMVLLGKTDGEGLFTRRPRVESNPPLF
jgi:hypothetical protein